MGLGDLYEHLRTLLPEELPEMEEEPEDTSPHTVTVTEHAQQEAAADAVCYTGVSSPLDYNEPAPCQEGHDSMDGL